MTKHLKEVHGLVAEKVKPGRPSTSAGGPWHQDHAKMNVRILGNAMAVQRWNDQKVVSRARAKAEREWNHLVVVAKQCPPLLKPALVKLVSEQLLKVLGLNAWGVGGVLQDVTSRMEKDENLQGWFHSPIVYMHDNWRWHGMSKIGIESLVKQVGQNSWQMFWISMNLKWFMEGKKQ